LVSLTLALGLTLGLLCLLGRNGIEPPTVRAAAGDVYCVAPGGGTYAACTQVFTHVQAAVNAASGGEEIRVAAGTYTGMRNVRSLDTDTFTATQVLVITRSLTIRGGYTTADWSTADPTANTTTLDAQGLGRVLLISGTIAPNIEGLRITGGDATGLGGDLWGRDGGGGVYIWEAAPTISGCVVTNNTASRAEWASGGGLFVRYGAATLRGNTVVNNTASTAGQGCGGGLNLRGGNNIVSGNSVANNTASTVVAGHGGGVCLRFGRATLSGNTVISNTASTAEWGHGGGVFVRRATATLSGNTLRGNMASTGTGGSGGGLYCEMGNTTLTNNVVADNQAETAGSGLWFEGISADPTSAQLFHNTIVGRGSTRLTTGDSGQGVFVGDYATLALTNTIIAGHSGVGITVTAGSTATLEATLWYDNGADTGGAGAISTGTVNVFGDPAFVDPAGGDYHLNAASAAINKGVTAGVTTDIDGHERPQGTGYDIGADEYVTPFTAYLPLVLRSSGGRLSRGHRP
jgi:hypothetical protein